MTKEVTINKIPLVLTTPYAAGHVVTEAEAKSLNQSWAENIGNNMRAKLKEPLDAAGGDVEAVKADAQKAVSEYEAGYEFTMASVGGGRRALDPLERECRSIANDFIMGKLKEAGMTKKAYIDANGEEVFKAKVAEIAENEAVVKQAKKNLAEREKMAGLELAL
jgi:hypothetical protein